MHSLRLKCMKRHLQIIVSTILNYTSIVIHVYSVIVVCVLFIAVLRALLDVDAMHIIYNQYHTVAHNVLIVYYWFLFNYELFCDVRVLRITFDARVSSIEPEWALMLAWVITIWLTLPYGKKPVYVIYSPAHLAVIVHPLPFALALLTLLSCMFRHLNLKYKSHGW